jgi:LmbE family N-acetylglucosaminyl deacetylase
MERSTDSAIQCLDWLCSLAPKDPARFSVTVVAAHPDDEIIGAGVRLGKLSRVSIVYLTDGSPRNMRDARALGFSSVREYARARSSEALAALSLCGVSPAQVFSSRRPDQQAAYNLAFLSRTVASIFRRLASDIVLTHPYEGGHPDHDSGAFCVHTASALLRRARLKPPTAIIEFTSYHAGDEGIESGRFLDNGGQVRVLALASEEQRLKLEMLAQHRTQRQVLSQFSVATESFRLAPNYDFTNPPDAPIYYDRFDWGLKSADWTALASTAIRKLKFQPPDAHPR